jgi:hypothetical protein
MMYQHGLMSTYREAWRRRGAHVCPRGVLKLESKSDLLGDKLAQRLRVVDL